MGAVWAAVDDQGNRAAVKRVPLVGWEEAGAALEKALAPLFGFTHRNLVEVLEVLPDGQGVAVASALVDGRDVSRILLEASEAGSPGLPPDVVVPILIGMADGLGALHSVGVVHGDLKPTNVLMTERGAAVSDPAVASVLARSDHWGPEVLGTVGYLDPEALRQGFLDRMSDIYSLGICGYEMLSGRQPFDGRSATAVMQLASEGSAPSLAELAGKAPPELVEALEACIAPRADYRPLASDICRVLHGVPSAAPLVIPPLGSGPAPAEGAGDDVVPGAVAESSPAVPHDNAVDQVAAAEAVAPLLQRKSVQAAARSGIEDTGTGAEARGRSTTRSDHPVAQRGRRPLVVRAAAALARLEWSPQSRRTVAMVGGVAAASFVALVIGRTAASPGRPPARRPAVPRAALRMPSSRSDSSLVGPLLGAGAITGSGSQGRGSQGLAGRILPVPSFAGGVLTLKSAGTAGPQAVRVVPVGAGQLMLGRWSCGSAPTAAVYEPGSGIVYYFRSWPRPGQPVSPAGQGASGITGGTAKVVTTRGCSRVVVTAGARPGG